MDARVMAKVRTVSKRVACEREQNKDLYDPNVYLRSVPLNDILLRVAAKHTPPQERAKPKLKIRPGQKQMKISDADVAEARWLHDQRAWTIDMLLSRWPISRHYMQQIVNGVVRVKYVLGRGVDSPE